MRRTRRTDLATAVEGGYRINFIGDGIADISKPTGETYHVDLFDYGCDCPDKTRRGGSYSGYCKHEIWIGKLTLCRSCGGEMVLQDEVEGLRVYECLRCGNAKDARIVKEERAARRGRTNQAA